MLRSSPGSLPPPVIARFVHHVWMMDITVVRAFLGGEIHVAGLFDDFSRVPLALRIFGSKPGAAAMARLLKAAARTFSRPKYLLTDQGGEFAGRVFRKTAARLGTVHRFGSVDNLFATARLERFWRTLKETAHLRLRHALTAQDLERTLELALTHYLCFRPHQRLSGATPAEAFLGVEPAILGGIDPPRALPGLGPREAPFTVAHLDEGRRAFPYLRRTA